MGLFSRVFSSCSGKDAVPEQTIPAGFAGKPKKGEM
jgi:hypothetical protein